MGRTGTFSPIDGNTTPSSFYALVATEVAVEMTHRAKRPLFSPNTSKTHQQSIRTLTRSWATRFLTTQLTGLLGYYYHQPIADNCQFWAQISRALGSSLEAGISHRGFVRT
jgi:hypothetical protein